MYQKREAVALKLALALSVSGWLLASSSRSTPKDTTNQTQHRKRCLVSPSASHRKRPFQTLIKLPREMQTAGEPGREEKSHSPSLRLLDRVRASRGIERKSWRTRRRIRRKTSNTSQPPMQGASQPKPCVGPATFSAGLILGPRAQLPHPPPLGLTQTSTRAACPVGVSAA